MRPAVIVKDTSVSDEVVARALHIFEEFPSLAIETDSGVTTEIAHARHNLSCTRMEPVELIELGCIGDFEWLVFFKGRESDRNSYAIRCTGEVIREHSIEQLLESYGAKEMVAAAKTIADVIKKRATLPRVVQTS
jgi:hypothetical protein